MEDVHGLIRLMWLRPAKAIRENRGGLRTSLAQNLGTLGRVILSHAQNGEPPSIPSMGEPVLV